MKRDEELRNRLIVLLRSFDYDAVEKRAIDSIQASCYTGDTEADHSNADEILLIVLKEMGFKKLVEEYNKVDKWFA